MNGSDLLKYIRFRNDSKGDLGRLERQKFVVMKLFSALKEHLSVEFIEKEFTKLLAQMKTDFTVKDLMFVFLKLGTLDNIEFFSYPYLIAANGTLYSDEEALKELRQAFQYFEKIPVAPVKKSVCIVNCTSQTARVFSIVSYNRIHSSGIPYYLLDTQLSKDIYSSVLDKNTLMILDGTEEEMQALEKQLVELYESEFDVLNIHSSDHLEFYYTVMSYYLKKGIFYPTPLEALVFIKSQ